LLSPSATGHIAGKCEREKIEQVIMVYRDEKERFIITIKL
jgi:hypothetical protein